MKGWNLPDDVSPNSPDAPWNQEQSFEDTLARDAWDAWEEEQAQREDEEADDGE